MPEQTVSIEGSPWSIGKVHTGRINPFHSFCLSDRKSFHRVVLSVSSTHISSSVVMHWYGMKNRRKETECRSHELLAERLRGKTL